MHNEFPFSDKYFDLCLVIPIHFSVPFVEGYQKAIDSLKKKKCSAGLIYRKTLRTPTHQPGSSIRKRFHSRTRWQALSVVLAVIRGFVF